PRDTARANHALSIDDPLYDCEYPLREWRWDRPDCVARIQADPELAGVAAVLFDEVHERSLDSDFGLALALDAQAALRPDLR
ncbi:hypothetical protein NY536_29245, partial [Enterobacter hormaechei]|nr:hypothetical protein [Enterobacter hormaechei]